MPSHYLYKILFVGKFVPATVSIYSVPDSDETTLMPFVCGSRPSSRAVQKEDPSKLAMRSFLLNVNEKWPRATVPFETDPAFCEYPSAIYFKIQYLEPIYIIIFSNLNFCRFVLSHEYFSWKSQ